MNETFRNLVDEFNHLLTSLTDDEYDILYDTYCKLYHNIYPDDNDWENAFENLFYLVQDAKKVVDKWREEYKVVKPCGASVEPMKDKGVTSDPVNHPSHYTYSSIEPIDAIEAWQLPYHLGNVVKYVSRAGHKDKSKTLEDLKKANWYLSRYIMMLEQEEA